MDDSTQVSSTVAKMLIFAANKLSLPTEELLQLLPHNIEQGTSEAARYPMKDISRVWLWFSKHITSENVGFVLARATPITSQSMLTFLFMSSETLEEGLKKIIFYQPLFIDEGKMELQTKDGESQLICLLNKDPSLIFGQQNEFFILLIHQWFSDLFGSKWRIKQLCFTHSMPESIKEYNQVFKCKLSFSAPANSIIFDSALLSLAVPYANPQINSMHEQHAHKLLEQLNRNNLVQHITQLIDLNLESGNIQIEAIAREYNLSERQLKFQLQAQGTNFSELLDKTKKKRATILLDSSETPIAEIADACGFSDLSSFNRAFKRWFAIPPSLYRKQAMLENYKSA